MPWSDQHRDPAPRPPMLWRWQGGGLILGLLMLAGIHLWRAPENPTPAAAVATTTSPIIEPIQAIDLAAVRARAWASIAPRLDAADHASTQDIAHGLDELRLFFEDRKQGARPFAESVLSLRGKWALVKSKLPLADHDGHLRFLHAQFAAHVFNPQDLQTAIESAIGAYVGDLQAIENRLLVDVRADLADLPAAAIPTLHGEGAFQAAFQRLLMDVAATAAHDGGVDVPRWVGSWVAGDVAAKIALRVAKAVAARLGVTTGLFSAGAAGSWASFGLSIVAAIVVDVAADWVIGWFYDPEAEVAARVEQTLDRVRQLIVEGDAETPGLRRELERLNQSHAVIRREALRRLVLDGF